MQRLSFVLAAPAALLLFPSALGRGAQELALAPKEGLVLEKRGDFSAEMELEQFKVEVNGEEIPLDAPKIKNTFSGVTQTTDTYAKVADGRVQRLERSFDELAQHSRTESPDGEDEGEDKSSPLEGATVVFDWSDEDDDYKPSFAEGSGEDLDEDLLADLKQSLDFELLLPGKDVDEGDEWTLGSEGMRAVLELGGDFQFEDDDESPQDDLISEALEDKLEGTATCTYRGTREVDGHELAVIELALAGTGRAEADADEEGVDVHRTVDAEMELEGELLWDTAAGHFAHLGLKGTVGFTLVEKGSAEGQEQQLTVGFAGTMSIGFAATEK
jgi:hypothetical protein